EFIPVVVLSTCGDLETAERIATHLVDSRLAACVNLVPQIKSFYHWQGKLEQSSETLLLVKTSREFVGDIESVVKELSGYEVPEVIALEITAGSQDYVSWLQHELSKEN
ncbi:MAG: divalent-cation tolerance protein CutA, partial [bacterium]